MISADLVQLKKVLQIKERIASLQGELTAMLDASIPASAQSVPANLKLHRVNGKAQKRLAWLMERNNEAPLTENEAAELASLGKYAETLSLANAQLLAVAAQRRRTRPAAGLRPQHLPPVVRKSRRKSHL